MNGKRETVGVVVQEDDEVRAPAADERNEDDEDCLHLTNGLYRCHVIDFNRILCSVPKRRRFGDLQIDKRG